MVKRNRTTHAPAPNETISKRSLRLSAQRDGRETGRVTLCHDRVENSPCTIFELVTGIVLVETGAPGMPQKTLESNLEVQDCCHADSLRDER